ncbi:MAG: glycoside hydrolase family 3 protein, partial [Firmicutes bacterium]|nr:glycoside hydrolase family 3 protein [Bacillota bacterium]
TDPQAAEENLSNGKDVRNFAEAIEKYHPGGFIYFNWNGNISTPLNPKQVQDLSNGLQQIAMQQRLPIPLLLATDQEGGSVARVKEPATVFPGNMALGATRSPLLAGQQARVTAQELKALGLNMDMAPVVDVNVNPNNPVIGIRSYGEDPKLVATLGAAQVLGYQHTGIAATAKHFPGHGNTDVDSHTGLPVISHDWEKLQRIDLPPFRAAIASGVDAVMAAHILVPTLDPSGMPASLSKPILTDLLRNQLGFRGVIVTDALDMQGAQVLPADRIPIAAIEAGADLLLMPPDVDVAYQSILRAVQQGEISQDRIDQSVERILTLKWKLGLFTDPFADPADLSKLGRPASQAVAARIADRSITLLKNNNAVLPLPAGEHVVVAGPRTAGGETLASLLQAMGIQADAVGTATNPSSTEMEQAVDAARQAQAVVVTTSNATSSVSQQQLVQRLVTLGHPVIVAAMGKPYDATVLPASIDAYLAAYGNQPVTVHALAQVLTGRIDPSGKLPVTIPGEYPFGAGLSFETGSRPSAGPVHRP